MKWDQAKYDKLREELAAMERTRAGYLDALTVTLDAILGKELPVGAPAPGSARVSVRAEKFAAAADRLRDALAPFDSGVREKAKESIEPIPVGFYFDVIRSNFFDSINGHAVSLGFKNKWMSRCFEFPASPR